MIRVPELHTLAELKPNTQLSLQLQGGSSIKAQIIDNLLTPESPVSWQERIRQAGCQSAQFPAFLSIFGHLFLKCVQKPPEMAQVVLEPRFILDVLVMWDPIAQTYKAQSRIQITSAVTLPVTTIEILSSS